MIEEQARYFLNENEKGTMMFYLKEYQNKHINLDSLVSGLFEILNTHSKVGRHSRVGRREVEGRKSAMGIRGLEGE